MSHLSDATDEAIRYAREEMGRGVKITNPPLLRSSNWNSWSHEALVEVHTLPGERPGTWCLLLIRDINDGWKVVEDSLDAEEYGYNA